MLRPGPCGRGLVTAMDSKFLLHPADRLQVILGNASIHCCDRAFRQCC